MFANTFCTILILLRSLDNHGEYYKLRMRQTRIKRDEELPVELQMSNKGHCNVECLRNLCTNIVKQNWKTTSDFQIVTSTEGTGYENRFETVKHKGKIILNI
jgi:hypothetical protein